RRASRRRGEADVRASRARPREGRSVRRPRELAAAHARGAVQLVVVLSASAIGGLLLVRTTSQVISPAMLGIALVLGLTVWRFGATGLSMLVVLAAVLVPVVSSETGGASSAAPAHATTVRDVGLAVLTIVAAAALGSVPRAALGR